MAKALICDVCRKPTNRIVAKLYLAPKNGGRNDHSNYTAHADVGECCGSRVPQMARWQRRVRQVPKDDKPEKPKKRQQRKKREPANA